MPKVFKKTPLKPRSARSQAPEIITVEKSFPQPPLSETAAIIQMLERIASNTSTVDIDKMERVMLIRDRELTRQAEQEVRQIERDRRQAEREFNEAMTATQAALPRVRRDAFNEHTKSHYAKLETVHAKCMPTISANGFSLSFGTDVSPLPNHYRITIHVARGGHSRDDKVDVPTDLLGPKGNPTKTATHAWASTITYGRRYLTLLQFNVVMSNEDDDGVAAGLVRDQPISAEQAQKIRELLRSLSDNAEDQQQSTAKLLQWQDKENIEDITVMDYDKVIIALQRKVIKKQAIAQEKVEAAS